ncbi:hypothetical protein J5N97_008709 [Dioscorea zingiberensis]|uniref:Protein kinase domain-containing protein n=1 Tax=Dioscorea zingiberensis TaxID=325984 RepID=A0A9D5CWM9_9LILI|nr:hypothetical protein J5N97_008709 [Dioscorea zingiberensis]
MIIYFCRRFGLVQAAEPLFVDCGSNSSIEINGRTWIGDTNPTRDFTLNSPGIVGVGEAKNNTSLYRAVRIFNTTANYNFSLVSGTYYVRLHFFPLSFSKFNPNESSFDVNVNSLKLVSHFNITEEISLKNFTSLVKECFLDVSSSQLVIGFVPISGSFAFVNAIEVVPVFNRLFVDPVSRVGGNGLRDDLNLGERGMETIYRLNVGVPELESSEDHDLWRQWKSDERFMFTLNAASTQSNTSSISYSSNESHVAPVLIYETARVMINNEVIEKKFNMSWKFSVDSSFDYLIRLHFCELYYEKPKQRMFKIYINKKTAAENFDVFVRAGGKNKAYHEDYLVDSDLQQSDTLWLQLGPDSSNGASSTDALLNGLEIFKLSKNGNFGQASNKIDIGDGGSAGNKARSKTLWLVISASILSFLILLSICVALVFCLCIHRKKDNVHGLIGNTMNAKAQKSPLCFAANGSNASSRTGRRFTISEIRVATENFDESLIIGNGGFGKVYKGEIEEGTPVAIKRANPESEQGIVEFETEIEMLSKLRHRHLVSMIGYCDEENEMILVYEYMANGTLRSHLYGSNLPPLTWKQRLEACIGAARGLHYLHTGADKGIIHRDVKTTNILLDENFIAKMSDFGLSKTGPGLDRTHVSTAVKGSFGYLDPEYFRRQQLTQKSDVYSFGVVLFEVVCARPVINPTLPKDEINIAEWAIRWQRRRSLVTIVDTQLQGNYSLESLKKFGEIAEKCLEDEAKNRPTMGEVLWHLEYALQLHETFIRNGYTESFAAIAHGLPLIKEGDEEVSLDLSSSSIEHSAETKADEHEH